MQRVEKLRHASQKCKHFFEGMQAAARTRFRSHTCGLGSVFSDVHAAGKHDLTSSAVCGRRNSARLLQHKSKKYTLLTVCKEKCLLFSE